MTDLYTFLHRREMRRGDRLVTLIRLVLLLPLMAHVALGGKSALSLLFLGTLALYGAALFLAQRRRFLPLLSGLSLIVDSLILAGVLFGQCLGDPLVPDRSPLLFLYPLIIYMAYLHGDEAMLILTTILNIILYNTVFLLNLAASPFPEGPGLLILLAPQLFRTLILIIFAVLLMEQSRRTRIILRNQNDYYEKVRRRNQPLFENLEAIAEEYGLSRREGEVLKELLKGKTYRAMGEDLFVSLDTIKSHVKSIYRKTGLKSRSELFRKLHGSLEPVPPTPSGEGTLSASRNGA